MTKANFRFAEAVLQAAVKIDDDFSAVAVLRAEPEQRTGIDTLEAYVSWHPAASGPFSWSVKAGAFFPTISLENDDLGWTSPYTLTPSAINSWIGEELRTIGSEAILRYDTGGFGTVSLTGAVTCCNDPAGVLMADRGWAMDDRPSGLFERCAPARRHLETVSRARTRPHRHVRRDRRHGRLVCRPHLADGGHRQDYRCSATTMRAIPTKSPANMPPGTPDSGVSAPAPSWDRLVLIAQGLQRLDR